MQRKFLTNLGLLLFLNLLVKPFWIFGIDLTVQNTVGAADYGFYSIVLNFSFLFNILLDFGITNFNNRNIAQNSHLLNKHFSGILLLKLVLGLAYFLVTFIVALLLKYNTDQLVLLGILAFNQFLVSLILYFRSNISGLLMFKTDSLLSVLDRLLMILFCGVLLWGHVTDAPFRIEWFVYSQTVAYLLTALVAMLIVIRKARFRRMSWNRAFIVMIIKQSYPFALMVLLMTMYNRLDPVMIGSLLPKTINNQQAGIYASGFRLLDAANMIAFLFAVLLVPIFSKMLKQGDPVGGMVKLSFTLIITVAIIVAAGSFFYSYPLMNFLYHSHIQESAAVFRVLMLGFIAVSTTYIFGTLLTANGSLKQLNMISVASILVNLCMNFILIPRLLAVGAAFASLATQSMTAVLQVIVVQRIFGFKLNYRYFLTLALFVGGVILINFLSLKVSLGLPGIRPDLAWMPNFLGAVVLSIALAMALRLLSFRSILGILRSDRS